MKKMIVLLAAVLLVVSISAEILYLDVMFTNDIHGAMDRYEANYINPEFPPVLGGGGSHATYINMVRAKGDGVTRDNFLVDAGDYFMGRPLGSRTDGKAMVEYFNMVGYDLSVIGNHEYDLGEDALIEMMEDAEFDLLSMNTVIKGTTELVPYVKPYVIKEKMGIKFALIGINTLDTILMGFPDHIGNIDVIPPEQILGDVVKEVREKGADIVIAVGHMGIPWDPQEYFDMVYGPNAKEDFTRRYGYNALEIAHEVPGIDLMFCGHYHFAREWTDPVNHTMLFQGWANGSSLGHITIKIDKETKTVMGREYPVENEEFMISMFEEAWTQDPVVGARIAELQAIAEEGMDEVVGFTEVDLSRLGVDSQNIIGNFFCDAMLSYAEADFSFINMGGLRGEIRMGPITHRDIFTVMPFENFVVVLEVDGMMIKEILETRVADTRGGLRVGGITMVHSRKRENFDRITKLLIGGEPWRHDKMYRIVTTDYLSEGNAGLIMLPKIPDNQKFYLGANLREAVADYVSKNSPIRTKIDDRWRRDDNSSPTPELLEELRRAEASAMVR